MPTFEELPFIRRPDLTPYLIHLTKRGPKKSPFENLVNILKTGTIFGSTTESGFIKGEDSAACFMDVPFHALKYVLDDVNCDPEAPKYEPYGVFFTKEYGYEKGCRPVLYLSDDEVVQVGIPDSELWRVVRFEVTEKGWISWIHEREWRAKGDFCLPSGPVGVLVRNTTRVAELSRILEEDRDSFASIPKTILPLNVICQGLPYLPK